MAFHRQCNVLSMANLAQVVNVLQSAVMTEGQQMWLTPTYYALNLQVTHIGAQALPVIIETGDSLPDATSSVSATASTNGHGVAVTFINRHYTNEAVVRFRVPGSHAQGQLMSANHAHAVNSAQQPDHVRLVDLPVSRDGEDNWCVDLPAHSMATVLID